MNYLIQKVTVNDGGILYGATTDNNTGLEIVGSTLEQFAQELAAIALIDKYMMIECRSNFQLHREIFGPIFSKYAPLSEQEIDELWGYINSNMRIATR